MRLRSLLFLVAVLGACTSNAPPPATPSPSPTPTPTSSPTVTPPITPSPSLPLETPIYVPVIGDWGAASEAQRQIASRMCSVEDRYPFDDVITTGDNFYPSGTATVSNFNEPEACLIRRGIRWRASWGNHDAEGNSTASVLGAERYYAWRAGDALFVALDANNPDDRAQRSFLRDTLSASRDPIKIVYFHQPAYTAGLHPAETAIQRHWVPLFEQYKVTLVLAGHNHDYEHLRVSGIDYVVTGGGGKDLYDCRTHPQGLIRCESRHHFVLLTLLPSQVKVEAIAADGSRFDSFAIAV
jgi:tartrate-resistant acid phosphatase type 5